MQQAAELKTCRRSFKRRLDRKNNCAQSSDEDEADEKRQNAEADAKTLSVENRTDKSDETLEKQRADARRNAQRHQRPTSAEHKQKMF